jgi:hypothetical protein
MPACLMELRLVCRQPWSWPVRSFGSTGLPAQASCPCSPVLIRGALVGLFGRVVVALRSILVILSSAVSGLLPRCVLAFGAVCLCLLCVVFFVLCFCGCLFCYIFLSINEMIHNSCVFEKKKGAGYVE